MEDLGNIVEELRLDGLRPSTIHRMRLHVVEDGSGLPVTLPVMVARGQRDGPVLGVVAAVHGDEVNGIPAIHSLFSTLEPKRLRGTVVGVLVVNYPAFDRHTRRYLDGVDLNHIMPGRRGGNASAAYANRIMDRVVGKFDYLIDLHTASRGRINSLYARADLTKSINAKLAHLLRPQIIVHKQPRDGSLRGEAAHLGIPAVTLEIGNPMRFQPEFIRTTVRGLRAVMAHLEMIKSRRRAEGREPIVCGESFWKYTDRGGLLTVHPELCQRLRAGEQLGEIRNVYGDVTERYEMPVDGVIIGKAVNPVGYTGARIAHIGVESPIPTED
jgi:predicted deacylase